MEICMDFMEYLGPDTSMSVLMRLDDPADIARVSSVSRSWRRFVITNGFFKNLCLRMCPELSRITHTIEANSPLEAVEAGSSTTMELEGMEREHKIYGYISHCHVSPIGKRDCIIEVIRASSTDNYPYESIENTLEPRDRVGAIPSYWSSKGERDPEKPETLTYRLASKFCLVHEIKIHPFAAFFQNGSPLYSAKAVRFRMGHFRLSQETGAGIPDGFAAFPLNVDENFVCTYVSPNFQMAKQNVLQSFKLPRPIFCIGGIIQVELLGRMQKQEMDDLYYICVSHVQVIGRPLSQKFDVEILGDSGNALMKHFPNPIPEGSMRGEAKRCFGRRHLRAGGGWINSIPNALLGTVVALDESASDEDETIA